MSGNLSTPGGISDPALITSVASCPLPPSNATTANQLDL